MRNSQPESGSSAGPLPLIFLAFAGFVIYHGIKKHETSEIVFGSLMIGLPLVCWCACISYLYQNSDEASDDSKSDDSPSDNLKDPLLNDADVKDLEAGTCNKATTGATTQPTSSLHGVSSIRSSH